MEMEMMGNNGALLRHSYLASQSYDGEGGAVASYCYYRRENGKCIDTVGCAENQNCHGSDEQGKGEHIKGLSGLLQQLRYLNGSGNKITMDLITKLPRSDYSIEKLARSMSDEIFVRQRVSDCRFISDRDGRFTSRYWQTVQKALGRRRVKSGEGIVKRVMLQIDVTFGILKLEIEFDVKYHLERVYTFWEKGKLAPRYVGPFEILERIGLVAYRLKLPEELSGVHDTFHVMTPELHRQFENSLPYDMLQELKSMFEKQAEVERFYVIQTFHALLIGAIGTNYNMHNMGKTIGELHALLIEYEKGLPKNAATPQVLAIQGGRIQKPNKEPQTAKGMGLRGERKLKQGVVYLYMGNGARAEVEAF
ncbi:hypothetical protein Tco_0639813 [Tanacetum coccineum]